MNDCEPKRSHLVKKKVGTKTISAWFGDLPVRFQQGGLPMASVLIAGWVQRAEKAAPSDQRRYAKTRHPVFPAPLSSTRKPVEKMSASNQRPPAPARRGLTRRDTARSRKFAIRFCHG